MIFLTFRNFGNVGELRVLISKVEKNVSLTKHFRPCQEILTLQHLERCNTDIENFKFQMIPYLIDLLLSKGAKKANCYCS